MTYNVFQANRLAFFGTKIECLSFIDGWGYRIFRKDVNHFWVG